MNKTTITLQSIRQLTADTYELIFSGDMSPITRPGQFVNITLPTLFLRRPISVCDWEAEKLTLLVKVAGEGTAQLVRSRPGECFDALLGLGNGFALACDANSPVLVGGGIGAAPLYGLARRMVKNGKTPAVVLGFRTGADAYYLDEFRNLGCQVAVATEDGTTGVKGLVTDCIFDSDYVYTCGPLPMLKAVHALPQLHGGQFSFEARMGCGFGACVGCTIPVVGGLKRVCKDGPVLCKEEIVW